MALELEGGRTSSEDGLVEWRAELGCSVRERVVHEHFPSSRGCDMSVVRVLYVELIAADARNCPPLVLVPDKPYG